MIHSQLKLYKQLNAVKMWTEYTASKALRELKRLILRCKTHKLLLLQQVALKNPHSALKDLQSEWLNNTHAVSHSTSRQGKLQTKPSVYIMLTRHKNQDIFKSRQQIANIIRQSFILLWSLEIWLKSCYSNIAEVMKNENLPRRQHFK